MRVYPGVLTVRDVARWLCASPTTERASTFLILAGAGLALGSACWGLARVSNLVLAPRTFLVLFTLAWLASARPAPAKDRKSTRLNSSHVRISYAVFCLKK